MEKYIDTSLFDKALIFATQAHKDTERRGKGFPYIIHPLEVASIVATMTNDQELLAAALLHDVVEDTSFTLEDIRNEFGSRVASIVDNESDIKVSGVSEEDSWKDRKIEAINRLARASYESKIVALGDKLSNMRAIYSDYLQVGDKVWDKFHAKEKEEHEWHYRGLADSLKELSGTNAYQEFVEKINFVFKNK